MQANSRPAPRSSACARRSPGSELFAGGVLCGAAGFAELGEHASGAELLADARERLSLARRRAYFPSDPTQPLAG